MPVLEQCLATGELVEFGDYSGGTRNPSLSFLALMALIYTVRQEEGKEDLIRLMDRIVDRDGSAV